MKKEVIGLLVVSIVFIAVTLSAENHNLFENRIKIGDIVYNLSMAYLASFIFYFFVVFLPDQRSRKSISPYIQIQTNTIASKASVIFEYIRQRSNHELVIENATATGLEQLLACIKPYESAPAVHPDGLGGVRQANWMELFASAIRETRIAEEKLLSHSLYVDAGIIERTRAVTNCPFFSSFELLTSMRLTNSDLRVWGSDIFEWMKLCQELKGYTDRELAPYL